MKTAMLVALFFSGSAFAEVPTVRAAFVNCQALKDMVEKYGAVNVKKKSFIFMKTKYVQHKANCSADQYTRNFVFKTKDNRSCTVGEFCEDPYVPSYDTEYSGSYSGSTYDSGSWGSSGSSSGSSYNPPSSSYEGPRYDPSPSSGRGDSYDPPSRGERGSRYCPSCN